MSQGGGSGSAAGGRGRRILVVEDDGALRGVISKHLEGVGHEVEAVGSAERVLDRVATGLTHDLALVDVHLPGMSGVELARLLLVTAPLNPVILITGDDDERLAREALAQGVASYLLKPFELFELDAALSQGLGMLDLVETTEALARAQSENLDDWGEAGGSLPRSWLHVGDERSSAGAGHGPRVVSIAGLLAKVLGERVNARTRDILRTAARTHEIGRLLGGGTQEEVAARTARILDNLGFDPGVGEVVRDSVMPWSPGLPLPALVLSVADRLDHDAARRLPNVDVERDAVVEAVDTLLGEAGETVDPTVADVLRQNRENVESMWVIQHERVPA